MMATDGEPSIGDDAELRREGDRIAQLIEDLDRGRRSGDEGPAK
jgi:hypothetical protein